MAERDDEDDAETMVANRQMMRGLEALGRGSSAPPPGHGSTPPPRSPDFPAGLVRTMPMAPPAHAVLPRGGAPELAPPEGLPQLVINFLLICGVITAFGLMTLIYLNI
ncbi:MAG: hypothetical protein ABI193_01580 [Minicystis sp.]